MSDGRGLEGHLELVCDVDSRGQTRLRHQSFCAPFHLSKPYREGEVLVLNVVNPTAGFLDGDRLRSDVRVERGAHILLTNPSASRVHTMRGGNAEVNSRFRVETDGSLEVWPELLIPQRSARYIQQTDISLDEGAELLFFETLAPGRAASGEVFAYDEMRWRTDLRLGSRLVARERYQLVPGNGSVAALRRRFPHAYYASAFLVSPRLSVDAPCWGTLRDLQSGAVWIGTSPLAAGAFALKVLADDSVTFRRVLHHIRREIYRALGRPLPNLRRAGDPAR